MVCVFLALHYLLFIFERQEVKLGLMRYFQAQLRPINQLLRQQVLQVSLRLVHMQTHIGRDGGQVLKMWCSNLRVDKVPQLQEHKSLTAQCCDSTGGCEAQQGSFVLG